MHKTFSTVIFCCRLPTWVVITTQNITVENVLYIPEMDGNYLSVPAIGRKGYHVSFDNVGCEFRKNGNLVAKAQLRDDTYILSSWKTANQQLRKMADLTTMHQRLGHTGWQRCDRYRMQLRIVKPAL